VSDDPNHVQGALIEFVDASSQVRSVLAGLEDTLLEGKAKLEAGVGVLDALFAVPVSRQRDEMQGVLDRFHTARHQFRLLMVAECASSGMNARQVGELWGFSRQRAHLLIQEAVTYASSLDDD